MKQSEFIKSQTRNLDWFQKCMDGNKVHTLTTTNKCNDGYDFILDWCNNH